MRAVSRLGGLLALAILAPPAASRAQVAPLTLPQASPAASVEQTVGLTKMEIRYHRPSVNKRKIWGDLVPWGEVWRAGANENTTIAFTSSVKVEGLALPAGTYGVHMVPGEKEWTVAFSNVSVAWGSFSYDEKEDALRVRVEPRRAPFEERLEYTFEDPTEDSVTAVLHWEELAVPIRITVDTPAVVVEGLRKELRGLPRFFWQGWNQAAAYCLANGVNLEEAGKWADRSIAINPNFNNLSTKAGLLEKSGDAKAAADTRARAMQLATEADINNHGYQLLGEKKYDEAIRIFQKNVKDYPKSWNACDSLGEAYLAKGDKKLAAEYYGKALAMATDEAQKKRISGILDKMKG